MSRDLAYWKDILDAARLARRYVEHKNWEGFQADTQCQDAVIRRLAIIGEAARRLSPESLRTFPDLPWSDIIGMRNFVIHRYDAVDLGIVWATVQEDLPKLIAALQDNLPPEEAA